MNIVEQVSVEPQPSHPKVKPEDDKVNLFCKWKKDGWSLVAKEDDETDAITDIEIPGGNDPCTVTIRLKPGASKLLFHPVTPLWAQEGSCPTEEPKGGPIATSQIELVSHGPTVLCFLDHNKGQPCTIGYALVFSDDSFLDPEIKNGGRV